MLKQAGGKCLNGLNSKFCAVLGAQWGDEGKGKLIDIFANKYDVVARFNGGANAGHTIKVGSDKYFFHLVPSGVLHPKIVNIVGNGCVLDPQLFLKEVEQLDKKNVDYKNRLFISSKTHITLQGHVAIEKLMEERLNIGTTKKGIGTTYAAKSLRFNLRMEDLMDSKNFKQKYEEFYRFLDAIFGLHERPKDELDKLQHCIEFFRKNNMVADTPELLHSYMKAGKRILAEGANGCLLDIDHGTYPFVTSSSTSAGGICTGLGVPPRALETIVGVVKAYTTRVGEGPFPTEFNKEKSEVFRQKGGEFGVTTGRARRCGWLDLNIMKRSAMLNGYSLIMISKLDVLSGLGDLEVLLQNGEMKKFEGWTEDISKARKFEQLPSAAKKYLSFIEEYLDTPISWIGVGPDREETIQKL